MSVLAENRRAKFDYEILETFEAGLVLTGQEVKSILNGRADLAGSHVITKPDGAYLIGARIAPYQPKNTPKEYDPTRTRKLLLNKKELIYLLGKTKSTGLTIVPISCYNKDLRIKLSIGLASRKKNKDKREVIAKRETNRELNRTLKKTI